jgi:hypothetical protein
MKYCMVVAGDSDFYTGACGATDRLGYMPLSIESGFHSYSAGEGDDVQVAVIDIESLRTAEIVERLHSLENDRRLMLLCPTREDAERLRQICSSLSGPAAIIPFSNFG